MCLCAGSWAVGWERTVEDRMTVKFFDSEAHEVCVVFSSKNVQNCLFDVQKTPHWSSTDMQSHWRICH